MVGFLWVETRVVTLLPRKAVFIRVDYDARLMNPKRKNAEVLRPFAAAGGVLPAAGAVWVDSGGGGAVGLGPAKGIPKTLSTPSSLPTQIVDRVSLGMEEPHEPNRLIWGDNLHVMRQIPSNSIDLIYIDPPFFSGREYNVMWGDANEMRSFNDIWEGGHDRLP